jgi:5-hydroxyisourate hydrolase-like protein (transthyretin family)
MKVRLFLLFLAVLVSAAASAATISGTVNPGTGMIVAAYDGSGNFVTQAAVDTGSRYSLTVSPGTYRLLAYDPNGVYATSFYPDADSFESSSPLNATSDLTNINFALVKGGYVAGTVTAAGGAPIANITVAVYNQSGTRRGFTKTDAAGHFAIVVPPGTYAVAAFDDTLKYVTTFFNNQATFTSANPVSVAEGITATANFTLAESVHITGSVTNASGAPLADIIVNAYDASGSSTGTTTNASGQYSLSLRAGTYRLVFEDPKGDYAAVYYPNAESFSVSTPIAAPAANINATMVLGGHVTGSVTPASNVFVTAYNLDGTVRTTTFVVNGQYSLVLPPGDYRIGAFDNTLTYASQFFSQQALFGAGSTLHVVSGGTVPNINFALHLGGRFSGMVIDRTAGTPLAGITVAAYDAAGTPYGAAKTRADGTYRFVVEPGVYRLVASDDAQRYATSFAFDAPNFDAAQAFTVAASQELSGENFAMVLAGKVSGTVTDARNGAPVAGVIVDAFNANGDLVARVATGNDGTVALALPPGTYKFVASDPLHRYTTSYYFLGSSYDTATPVTINSGASTSISFSMNVDSTTSEHRHRAVRH